MATDTRSEQHRHRCEVRWCIQQGFAWFETYIKGVKSSRGARAAKQLWADVKAQSKAGNTGAPGEWVS